jgi:hypothetical protein
MGTVVIGIIDDGIAFANARFRNAANQTRVRFALLQRMVSSLDLELTKADIDALIPRCTRGGLLDEDEFYARAGWVDMSAAGPKTGSWRAPHGTHVMDLACGYDPSEDRNDRPIVCVQLPEEVTASPSHAARSSYALEAMRYILRCADRIAGKPGALPVVINFSYGAIAGPHDGSSQAEMQIDDIVRRRKAAFGPLALEVVLPSGNSHLSRCHARVSFPSTTGAGSERELQWRVMPDDHTPSSLDLWMPCRAAGSGSGSGSRLRLTVTSPNGHRLAIDEIPGARGSWGTPARNHAEVSYSVPAAGSRGRFTLVTQPTAAYRTNALLAPAGVWTLKLENKGLSPDEFVHAWVERDDTPPGYPRRGRQSHFDESIYKRFDHGGREIEADDDPRCVVLRAGLINSIATGEMTVVTAGMLRKEMVAAPYSAGGPVLARCDTTTVDSYRPDAATVSDDSRVHRGILAAASRSGSVVAMGGTSVAAPQLTRWIGDRLASGLRGDRAAVQSLAASQEPHAPPALPIGSLPDPRYGAGRILLPTPPRRVRDTLVPRLRHLEP